MLCTLGLSACQRTVTPQQTAERYAEAIEGDDAAAARELFSDDLRERRPDARLDAEFERRVEAGAAMQEALEHAAESPASLSAQLAYADIERLDMELVGDSWQIVDGVLAPQPFATPRDALLGLVRALDTQNPELLYQLMPPDFRYETSLDALTAWMESEAAAIADTVQLLRRHIEDPMSVSEDRALLRYGSRTLVLHRAANRWFVWDFD